MPSLSRRRICSGCGRVVSGRCETCLPDRRAEADRLRGSSTERGYGSHWRRVIRPAFLRDHPLCVLCGALAEVPDHWPETRASLVARGVDDPDAENRLRALCKVCHDLYGLSYKPWSSHQVNDLVTVVAGPPCAGKNTWVEQHRRDTDVVIDYDAIMAQLSGRPMHDHDVAYAEAARRQRDAVISRLLVSGQRGWIISASPSARTRHQYHTTVMLLLPSQAVALERARACRPPQWQQYIRDWYRRYEPDDRDTLCA